MTPEQQEKEHHFNSDWDGWEKRDMERALWYEETGNPNPNDNENSTCTIIRPGMSLVTIRSVPGAMPSYHFDIKRMPVGFTFQLTGTLETNWQQCRKQKSVTSVFQKGSNALVCMNQTWGHSRYLSGEMVCSVGLALAPEVLADLLSEELNKIPQECRELFEQKKPVVTSLPMTAEMYRAASQVLHHPYHGVAERLHLESCALSLLALQIDRLTQHAFTRGKILRSGDEERVRAAADILTRHLTNPPTIAELSRQVGINESKLKWGFKKIFGQTTFQFLLCQRMNLARELLMTRDMDVSGTAFATGYNNISHFISSYKKFFGITPGCEKRGKNG